MIKRLLNPPHFESEDDNFRAKFINGFGLFLIVVLIAALIPQFGKRTADYTFFVLLTMILVMLASLYIMHRGYLRLSGIIVVVLTWISITFQALTAGGVKDVIIVAGRKHYPQDIELTVEQSHAAIRKGCCAAFSVEVDDEERAVPHNSLAFENANDDTRRVFSSKISVRVIGGSARWLQFSRSQSRQLTPIGVPSAFSRSIPAA